MSDLEWLASHLSRWELGTLVVFVVVTYVLAKLSEAHESVAKMVPVIGRRVRARAERRADERKALIRAEAKQIVDEMEPPDYAGEMQSLRDRMDELETKDEIQRQYLIYDEGWHFQDALARAEQGLPVPARIPFREFDTKYRQRFRLDPHGQWHRAPVLA